MAKNWRNIITLSDMEPGLEFWAREEAKRRKVPFYRIINEALRCYRQQQEIATGYPLIAHDPFSK